MKKYIFLPLVILFSFACFSQTTEPAIAKVFYVLKHKRDTANKDSVYTENMLLVVGKNSSIFCSLDKIIQAKKIAQDQDEQIKNWTGVGATRFKTLVGLRKANNQVIFQFLQEKKILIKEYLIGNYLYEEVFDDIKWGLASEIKIINNINCQKAVATYKGREWIAWFAPDIPFETGPWKLHGLPGLILEAYDNKKEVQFLFAGFENLIGKTQASTYEDYDNTDKIELPKLATKTTVEAVLKLKESMYKNPNGFLNAQAQIARGIIDSRDFNALSFKKINNPIEQPEK